MVEAIMPRCPEQPGTGIERVNLRQMVPEPQKDLLGGVFRVGPVREQGERKAINLIAMAVAQDFKLELTNHPFKAGNETALEIVTRKKSLGWNLSGRRLCRLRLDEGCAPVYALGKCAEGV